jgi:hypothetical protein
MATINAIAKYDGGQVKETVHYLSLTGRRKEYDKKNVSKKYLNLNEILYNFNRARYFFGLC